MKQGMVNRKQYEKIRKMDHNQMNVYIQEVYNNGFCDGQKEQVKEKLIPDLTGLEERLQDIRGVGGAKAVVIADAVRKFISGEVSNG